MKSFLSRRRFGWAFLPLAIAVGCAWSACGGGVDVETAASTTGAGGQGSTSATGANATSTNGATGTSGPGGTTGHVGSSGTGVGPCANLFEAECLGAFPTCVPVYDDTCCPTCYPGGCADCQAYAFNHCTS